MSSHGPQYATSATWVKQNNRIKLKIDNGETVEIDAISIFKAEFKGLTEINNIDLKGPPSKVLADIVFNRFPLKTRLCVVPPQTETRPYCWVESYNPENTIIIESVLNDQVISDNNWFPLLTEDLDDIKKAMEAAAIQKLGRITLQQYLGLLSQNIVKTVIKQETNPQEGRPHLTEEILNLDGFKGDLFHYQELGVKWLNRITQEDLGPILGDEMGLGKTVQVIALMVSEINETRKPSLVIAPATLLENWRREFKKFAPYVNVLVNTGYKRTGFPSKLKQFDVVITSYDTAVRDLSLLKMVNWNVIVIDEAQAIKNPGALRTRTIKELPKRVGLAVTGTPVENSLRDLWSIMDFCSPGLLGSQPVFEERFSDSVENASTLESIVSPLLLRRLISNVAAELPERINISQTIDMTEQEISKYIALRKEIIEEYGKSANLVSLIKLRMFCAHPFLIYGAQGDPALCSNKYLRLTEILDEVITTKNKVIIFTSFKDMINIFMSDLPERYPVYCNYIDGRVDVPRRQMIVDEFYEIQGPALLLLNPRAAGTGLNITAANYVIHYNLEWNPAVEDQASARAYRRGQDKPVTIYRLFYSGTVEEIIDEKTMFKRNMADNAVVGTIGEVNEREYIIKALEISPTL